MRILLTLLLLSASLFAEPSSSRPEKPNIVLILTDDLGWQDVKCYDVDDPSPYQTPHLDALAKKGMMFWQAYSPAPTCAPSRCAIISGNHPARAQKTHVVGGAPPNPRNKNVRMMDPWYSGRMPEDELTIARALSANGYTTAHCGKWHIAIDHNAFPQPKDVGFHHTHSDRGSRSSMKDRLTGFATPEKDDPFRLDENGYPFHQTNQDALSLLDAHKADPFFLYYATWLVHSPIHTRSKAHLDYYAKKLGIDPAKTNTKATPGQKNPFYAAMIQELDYYLGQVFSYLDTTDDPRWPGHKLSENTYLIFTSDNGGMEGGPDERYTDNYPLSRGKISAMEGGTRVPLIITGPGIEPGTQSHTIANGLDFYPTILAMTGTPNPADKNLDGCNLLPHLKNQDPVTHPDGSVRDTMVWHFPHGVALESTIRTGDYKLVRNYDHLDNPSSPPLELFQLYEGSERIDIEEANNLVETMPEKAREMNDTLTAALIEMKATPPYYNPDCATPLPNQEKAPTVLTHHRDSQTVALTFQDNGAKVTSAQLIYTLNGGQRHEEWFRQPGTLSGNTATFELPQGTTHYFLNLIDQNNFLRGYPKVTNTKGSKTYTASALSTTPSDQKEKTEAPKKKGDRNIPFNRWDTNKDDILTLEEYLTGHTGPDLETRFKRFDENNDGQVTRHEYVTLSAKK